MSRLIFIVSFLIIPCLVFAQKQAGEIEFNPYVRFDKYPQFSYVVNGRPSTDYVNIKGTSFGTGLFYKIPITQSVLLKAGIGFYKYFFDNIKKYNTLFGNSVVRNINFVSPYYIPFFTNRYRYNTITANIGVEKIVRLHRNVEIVAGVNVNNYFAFSEYYHLASNPGGGLDYRKNNKRYFGSSFYANASLLRKFGKISIGPSFILPLFDIWKMDETFPEEMNSGSRNKWLSGVGLGISVNYSLAKKLK